MIRLKELRLKNKYSQQQIADILKVNVSMVSRYENGRFEISRKQIIILCRLFNVTSDYLLNINEEC